MQTVSSTFNSLWAKPTTWVETAVEINGVTYTESELIEVRKSGGVFSSSTPSVGCCVSSELTVRMLNSTATIPSQATVKPKIRLRNKEQSSEWIQKGTFYIDTREISQTSVKILSLTCYDRMLYAEMDCPIDGVDWPQTDVAMVNQIASALGISVDSRTLSIMNKGYQIQLPNNYSAREVLSYIATAYGGNFVITDDNKLNLVPIGGLVEATTFDVGTSVETFLTQPEMGAWDRVELSVTDEVMYASGEAEGNVLSVSNPWGSQEMADNILERVKNLHYLPFTSTKAYLNPTAELGDRITIDGFTGVINEIDLTFGHSLALDVSSPGEASIDHEIPYIKSETREVNRKIAATKEELSSELAVTATEIRSSVTAVGEKADSAYNKASKIEQTANGLTITVSQIDEKVDTLVESYDVEYYQSNSATTLSGGSWSSTAPGWVDGKYMWTRTKVTYADGTIKFNPSATGTCISGAKGATGSTGATGKGVASITEEYYLSTSKTTQSGGSWVTTPPTWSSGKYMWTRSKIVYNNPASTVYTTPVCDSSWEAANDAKDEAISSAENLIGDSESRTGALVQGVSDELSNLQEGLPAQIVNEMMKSDEWAALQQNITEIRTTASGMEIEISGTTMNLNNFLDSFHTYFKVAADGLHIAASGSEFETLLGNSKLSFIQAGTEVAYIQYNRLYITEAWVKEGLAIGDPTGGKYIRMYVDGNNVWCVQIMGG